MGFALSSTIFFLVILVRALPNDVGCKRMCTFFNSVGGYQVIFPSNTTFSQISETYYSAQEGELVPSCIVRPSSIDDVSTFVKELSFVNHLPNSTCSFAIKGGGHMPAAGSANINHGITLDLSSLNQVSLDSYQNIIHLGSGLTWGHAYDVLTPLGLSVPGARNSEVGAPGFLTGGGISFFTSRTGFSCDNVVNFRVVLANGTVVDANANTNTDLWRGLRGGSNNFGIVVRFDVRIFTQSDYLGGSITFPISTLDDQVEAFTGYLSPSGEGAPDPYLSIIMTFSWSSASGLMVSNNLAHTSSNSSLSDPPASIQPFLNITPQESSTMRRSNTSDFVNESTSASVPANGLRNLFATTTFQADAALMRDVISFWNDTTTMKLGNSSASLEGSGLTFEPISTAITSKSGALGGDSLGLSPEDGNLVLLQLSLTWTSASDDQAVANASQTLIAQIDKAARSKSLDNDWRYLNYAAFFQDPIASYGPQTIARLNATSQNYDPTGFFQTVVPGGFKLPTE